MTDVPPPPPVPCAGCGAPVPVATGPAGQAPPPGASYLEHLKTPLGLTSIRTCTKRECVQAARARPEGKPTTWRVRDPRTGQLVADWP